MQIKIPLIGKVKHPTRWLLGLIASGFVVFGSTAYLIVNWIAPKSDIAELTLPVQAKDITIRITASGQVEAIELVNISPKTSGQLVDLRVEQGDKVKQGQIIARMDDRSLQAQLIQAHAKLQQSQAQLAEARAGNRLQEIEQAQARTDAAQASANLSQARAKRYRKLARLGAISQDQLDQYLSEYRSGTAKLQEAQRQLSLLKSGSRPEQITQRQAAVTAVQGELKAVQVQLEDTIIRAPFDGVVTQKYATKGAFVTPTISASSTASATSSSIVAIANGVEIVAKVPEIDIAQIQQGQQVEIVADAYPNQVFKGRVRSIAPAAVKEQNVSSFQVRIDIEIGKEELLSGMNIRLTFLGKQIQDALVVPTVAIVTEQGKTGVLVPGSDNKPQFHPVTIGSSIKDLTQILSGLNQGDRVFVDPPENYQPASPDK
ncbi:efflux transporter periplasmic adaptor subunit [cyanobacterium TDX16]|nr:efflux transporter periplasmic adaptor subunit [cyanobacterium TDX16]